MEWSTRRKVLYLGSLIVFLSTFSIYFLKDLVFRSPTCFDNKKNGFELGVDCGGTCSLKCSQEVSPPTALWTRLIPVSSIKYDLVAMIANKNIDNASHGLSYVFSAYDGQGVLLGTYAGSTTLPVDGDFPIVYRNASLPEFVKSLTVELRDLPHFQVASNPLSPRLRIVSTRFEQGDTPRVYVVIANTQQVSMEKIPVTVLLYDDKDTVYAVNQTLIPYLKKEESKELVFTWPGNKLSAPTKIRVFPLLDPFIYNK